MKSYSNVCIVIPAYNEERNIKILINKIKKLKIKKIVVVDDGSTDNTYKVAKKEGAIVLRHKINKGKGEALKTAFKYLMKKRIDHIVLIDADMQYFPEEIPKLIKPLINREADFVTGYRNWSNVPFRNVLGNFVWRVAFNILFGTNLKDTNCGFIAFSKKILSKINAGGGYIVENMMLASAIKNKLKISQVLVRVVYKKIHNIPYGSRVILGVLIFIIKEGIKYRIKTYKY